MTAAPASTGISRPEGNSYSDNKMYKYTEQDVNM